MEMLNLAEQWGWVGNGAGTDLEKLLKQMLDESDPRLPVGYIKLDEVILISSQDIGFFISLCYISQLYIQIVGRNFVSYPFNCFRLQAVQKLIRLH